jgi:flagellar protein FlaG
MMVEIVQNISSISPLENGVDPAAMVRPEKTISQQNEPIPNETYKTEVSTSLLNQVQENISMMHNINFQFSVHKATGRTIVKITDQDSGKLVREIPPEQLLDLAAKIDEMVGILFDKKA